MDGAVPNPRQTFPTKVTVERTPSSVRAKSVMTLTNGRRRPFYSFALSRLLSETSILRGTKTDGRLKSASCEGPLSRLRCLQLGNPFLQLFHSELGVHDVGKQAATNEQSDESPRIHVTAFRDRAGGVTTSFHDSPTTRWQNEISDTL